VLHISQFLAKNIITQQQGKIFKMTTRIAGQIRKREKKNTKFVGGAENGWEKDSQSSHHDVSK